MSGDRYQYRRAQETAGRKPSVSVRLPFVVKYLEPVFERMIIRLDVAEEQMDRLEQKLDRILAAMALPEEAPK